MLHDAACKILKKKGYLNLADAGNFPHQPEATQTMGLQQRVVEGYIANSLPLCQEHLNCLLPAEEKEKVGQVSSKNNNQVINRYDLYVDLSNNSNLSVAPPAENGDLILYGFSQFDVPDLRIENMDATNTGVPVL